MYASHHQATHTAGPFATLLLLVTMCLASSPLSAGDSRTNEYRIKAAFLYNFSRFVIWPQPPGNTFRLCIIGDSPFGDLLDSLTGKPVHESILVVEEHKRLETAHECQIAYISKSYKHRLSQVLAALHGRPVLTVSDIESFMARGGMIQLRLVDNRVRFDINTMAADDAGLSISSKLLSLATIVKAER
jgi:hypothetical protein